MLHASSMTPLTSMDELQDIEDLVVEGEEDAGEGVVGKKVPEGAGIVPDIGRTGLAPAPVAVDVSPSRRGAGGLDGEDGAADKYKKRSSTLMQAVQSCAPSWTGAVPESMRGKAKRDDDLDAMEGGGRGTPSRRRGVGGVIGGAAEKKHRRSDPRVTVMALSLLSCFATMALLYSRLSSKLPPP